MRTDWSQIWAQRGFRYFFFAMFISFSAAAMNFAGRQLVILAATILTVKVSLAGHRRHGTGPPGAVCWRRAH